MKRFIVVLVVLGLAGCGGYSSYDYGNGGSQPRSVGKYYDREYYESIGFTSVCTENPNACVKDANGNYVSRYYTSPRAPVYPALRAPVSRMPEPIQPRSYMDTSTGETYWRYNSGNYVGGDTVLRPFGPRGSYVDYNGVYYQKFGDGLINTDTGEFLTPLGGD